MIYCNGEPRPNEKCFADVDIYKSENGEVLEIVLNM